MSKKQKYQLDNDNKNAFIAGLILSLVATIFGLQIRFGMLGPGYAPLFNMVGMYGVLFVVGAGLLLLLEYLEDKME